MADFTYTEISKLLKYEPDTGKLFWRERAPDLFADGARTAEHQCKIWNCRFAGREALTYLDKDGYRVGKILGRVYKAHRVIWLLATGEWPTGTIDHINGDRQWNRLSNLRDVSRSGNLKNKRMPRTNKSGVMGVSWHRRVGKWLAQIRVDGQRKHIGYFDDIHIAAAARKKVEIELGFHPNHGRQVRTSTECGHC